MGSHKYPSPAPWTFKKYKSKNSCIMAMPIKEESISKNSRDIQSNSTSEPFWIIHEHKLCHVFFIHMHPTLNKHIKTYIPHTKTHIYRHIPTHIQIHIPTQTQSHRHTHIILHMYTIKKIAQKHTLYLVFLCNIPSKQPSKYPSHTHTHKYNTLHVK